MELSADRAKKIGFKTFCVANEVSLYVSTVIEKHPKIMPISVYFIFPLFGSF